MTHALLLLQVYNRLDAILFLIIFFKNVMLASITAFITFHKHTIFIQEETPRINNNKNDAQNLGAWFIIMACDNLMGILIFISFFLRELPQHHHHKIISSHQSHLLISMFGFFHPVQTSLSYLASTLLPIYASSLLQFF